MRMLGFAGYRLVLLMLACGWLAGCVASESLVSPEPVKPTVMITGASRGIGLELARQYAALGWGVIATCRTPAGADDLQALAAERPNVIIEELDVTDFAEMDALAARYAGVPIDVLINNAGILGGNDRQKFGSFDYAAFEEVMAVNVVGAVRMVETFVGNVAMSEQKKVMNISSAVGSVSMTFGGQKPCLSLKARRRSVDRNHMLPYMFVTNVFAVRFETCETIRFIHLAHGWLVRLR